VRNALEQKESIIQKIGNYFKDQWRKLADWIKVLIIGSVVMFCLLPIPLYLTSKEISFFGFSLETSCIWGIYAGGVTLAISSVLLYYQKRDKTEVKP